MNQGENESLVNEQESDKLSIELYKTAFARLNLQDEYLFKFSTVFLTVQGALAALVVSSTLDTQPPNYPVLAIASVIGLFMGIVWWLWTRHNDYWHSVWVGTLINIEKKHLSTKARVFDQVHSKIAQRGKRSQCLIFSGHRIARLVPFGFSVGWAVAFVYALYMVLTLQVNA